MKMKKGSSKTDAQVARELRQQLRKLTVRVTCALTALDWEMRRPSPRGSRIATICNALELDNDAALHFGLGVSLKKIAQAKKNADAPGKRCLQCGWTTSDLTYVTCVHCAGTMMERK